MVLPDAGGDVRRSAASSFGARASLRHGRLKASPAPRLGKEPLRHDHLSGCVRVGVTLDRLVVYAAAFLFVAALVVGSLRPEPDG